MPDYCAEVVDIQNPIGGWSGSPYLIGHKETIPESTGIGTNFRIEGGRIVEDWMFAEANLGSPVPGIYVLTYDHDGDELHVRLTEGACIPGSGDHIGNAGQMLMGDSMSY